jgi:secreted protein with Ig-like and vWFA domain
VTVSDGRLSATASATYTAYNTAPVAEAGLARTVARNTAVQVTGSGSDPDADPLTFTWSLAGPAGSTAALVDQGSVQAAFNPDLLGAYTLTLSASDGEASNRTRGTGSAGAAGHYWRISEA